LVLANGPAKFASMVKLEDTLDLGSSGASRGGSSPSTRTKNRKMMRKVFLISDLHLGHKGIVSFMTEDGISKMRPWNDVDEMNEILVSNWNSVVKSQDLVYNLGDVSLNKRYLPLLDRMNGEKRLILGNHDRFSISEYQKYFTKIYGSLKLDKFILTHYPVDINSIPDWCLANVHGHIHEKESPSNKHFNISVEKIDYTPIALDRIKQIFSV
jgi:calcineurin-like phosphoesterase family protein